MLWRRVVANLGVWSVVVVVVAVLLLVNYYFIREGSPPEEFRARTSALADMDGRRPSAF
jgi:hypothetical protein